VLVAIAATSAFGSVGGSIVGEGASFRHRPRQISAASAFVLPSTKQCVAGRELTIQLRTLPHVRWIGATVEVNGARFKTIKHSLLTRPVKLTDLPSGRFAVSIIARTSTGRSVTATRDYQTCVPIPKPVQPPVKPPLPVTPVAPVTPVSPVTPEEPMTPETPVTPAPGRFTGPSPQYSGWQVAFYVSPDGTELQDVSIPTVEVKCVPSGVHDVPLAISELAISNGSFTKTTEQEGEFEYASDKWTVAKYTYSFSAKATGTTATGTFRVDVTWEGGAKSCSSNEQAFTTTQEAGQGATPSAPPEGHYTGESPQYSGWEVGAYVSPGGGALQDLNISTVEVYCSPDEANDVPFSISEVPVESDAFTKTTKQEGDFEYGSDKWTKAQYTYEISGHVHGANPAGAIRISGIFRETITWEGGAKSCSSNEQAFTTTRESLQGATPSAPPEGHYTGESPQYSGWEVALTVPLGGGSLEDVSISTVEVYCSPDEAHDVPFSIAEIPIASNAFSKTVKEEGEFEYATGKNVMAQYTYEFSGHVHGANPKGDTRIAGIFRETVTWESGARSCSSNEQAFAVTGT
jgi:hypothetical protein